MIEAPGVPGVSVTPARACARVRGDGGLTVIELMVAVSVLSILLAAVATVFVGSTRTIRDVTERTDAAADARIGLEAMTRTLRVAIRPDGETVAITAATSSAITFYTSINRTGTTTDPRPTRVEYYWSGNCLMEAVTPARTLSNPPTTGPFYAWDTGRTARCLVRTTAAPEFAYFSTAQISSGGVTNQPLTVSSGGLTATQRGVVRSVQVGLTVRAPGAGSSAPQVLDRVTLANVLVDIGA